MTEADTFDAKNPSCEVGQTHDHEQTPDSDDKHSASSDSPAETTGGDYDTSSLSYRQEDDGETVRHDRNLRLSPSTENDENQFTTLVHEKDKEIQKLNQEIRKLRSEEINWRIREKELVEELERHAELVERQQNQLDEAEYQMHQKQQQITALRQQLQRAQQQLNSAVLQQQRTTKPAPPVRSKISVNDAATTSTSVAEDFGHGNSVNPDDVCAALNTFIEKNRANNSSVSEGDVVPELAEYLDKLIAENSIAGQQGNDEATQMWSAIISQLVNENGGESNREKELSAKSTKFNGNRPGIDGRSVGVMATEQPFYRGSAASSAHAVAVTSAGSSRGKFSQHIGHPNAAVSLPTSVSYAVPASLSTPSNPLNGTHNRTTVPNIQSTGVTPSSSSSNAKPLSEEEQRIVTEMQERIAANVASLGNRALNTYVIAHQCKRLMLAYNIGQRLFAKAVMCQVVKSQGSLSELLSKPRAWHKLTDKGREAFRRIYGWLSDDAAIELLCQLSPRRVAMPGDRIEHPSTDSLLDHGDSAVYEAEFQASRAAALANNGADETVNGLLTSSMSYERYDDDEEMKSPYNHGRKFSHNSPEACSIEGSSPTMPSLPNPGMASPAALSVVSTASSIRGLVNGVPANSLSTTSNGRWRHDDIPREKILGILEAEKAKLYKQARHCEDTIASNGGMSEDSTPNSPKSTLSNCSRFVKADLMPITQEQFDKHPVLDTEELVKQVKDYLGRHAVSQRQFGEAFLGLSQGSVSDLLARPKSWALLTPKGREPFIRMRMFLDQHANDEQPHMLLHPQGINFGMEEECRDTPEPDVLYKTVKCENNMENNSLRTKITPQLAESLDINVKEESTKTVDMPALDTAELCRRVKEFLLKNSISQRAFGDHVLNMSSGTFSDLLSRPKPWETLSPKHRDAFGRIERFMKDENAMETLRNSSLARTASNNNNATVAHHNSSAGAAGCSTSTSTRSNGIPTYSTTEYITPTAIANVVSTDNSNALAQFLLSQTQHCNGESNGSNKRKAMNIEFDESTPSGKKIPRFQRTVITDEQKEALYFIFMRDQRPSAKMIDQLAARLNLSSRTVTNWFHNYRTRQKAKENKAAIEAAANGLPPPPTKPNPLEVADPMSKDWYEDMMAVLAENANSTNNNSSLIMNENRNLSIPLSNHSFCTSPDDDMLKFDSLQQNEYYGHSGNNNNYGAGVELEDEEDTSAAESRSVLRQNGDQLIKLIDRLHTQRAMPAAINSQE